MEETTSDPATETAKPGIGDYYAGVCLVALVLMVVALDRLLPARSSYLPLLPLAFGAVALLFRLSSGPPVILILVIGLIMTRSPREIVLVPTERFSLLVQLLGCRILLTVAALTFVIAYYRRLGLESGIFPPDRRKAPGPAPGHEPSRPPAVRRAPQLATRAELVSFLLVLSLCTFVGFMIWLGLDWIPPPSSLSLDEDHVQWRLLIIVLMVALSGACASVFTGYLERAMATPTQNLLYLQDQLWSETRREQGRVISWIVRARLRAQRRKGKS